MFDQHGLLAITHSTCASSFKLINNGNKIEWSPGSSCFWRSISAHPGLNFNPGYFFCCCLKAFSRIMFSLLSGASNHQIVGKKNTTELLFKLSFLKSNFGLTLVNLTLLWTTRPIRSVIVRVIDKIGRPRSESPICLITSIITDRIGRHEVLLPINHNYNKICEICSFCKKY